MKLLLDTHTFLWLVDGSPSLSIAARIALSDPAERVVSAAASVLGSSRSRPPTRNRG